MATPQKDFEIHTSSDWRLGIGLITVDGDTVDFTDGVNFGGFVLEIKGCQNRSDLRLSVVNGTQTGNGSEFKISGVSEAEMIVKAADVDEVFSADNSQIMYHYNLRFTWKTIPYTYLEGSLTIDG